jgi:hypothetical protein
LHKKGTIKKAKVATSEGEGSEGGDSVKRNDKEDEDAGQAAREGSGGGPAETAREDLITQIEQIVDREMVISTVYINCTIGVHLLFLYHRQQEKGLEGGRLKQLVKT